MKTQNSIYIELEPAEIENMFDFVTLGKVDGTKFTIRQKKTISKKLLKYNCNLIDQVVIGAFLSTHDHWGGAVTSNGKTYYYNPFEERFFVYKETQGKSVLDEDETDYLNQSFLQNAKKTVEKLFK